MVDNTYIISHNSAIYELICHLWTKLNCMCWIKCQTNIYKYKMVAKMMDGPKFWLTTTEQFMNRFGSNLNSMRQMNSQKNSD